MFCPSCGHEHNLDANFCVTCGTKLTKPVHAPSGINQEVIDDNISSKEIAQSNTNHMQENEDTNPLPEEPLPQPAPITHATLPSQIPLGGWLILHAIGLAIAPIKMLRSLPDSFSVFTDPNILRMPASIRYFFYAESLGNILLFTFLIYTAYLFFGKRAALPPTIIKLYIFQFSLFTLDALLFYYLDLTQYVDQAFISQMGAQVAGTAIIAAIWIPYFLKSKRVKETFTKP